MNVTEVENNPTQNYLFEDSEPCEDISYGSCFNADRLLIFPKHSKLTIEAKEQQVGGNLKKGTYEFYVAYSDLMGNEMVQYSTPTNPISIFDENNNILSQTTTDEFTNFAIKLKINNLDSKNFKYYKVAVVERNNVENTQSIFVVGVYPTTDDTVVYTHSGSSNDDLYIARGNVSIKKRMDFNALNAVKPSWEKFKGTMVSGDTLWHYGAVAKEEINLQPVVNLFSSLACWNSSVAKEDLYKNSIATSKYKYYMRGEVQPFSIRFYNKDGSYTSNFPWIGRPKLPNDSLAVDVDGLNYKSLHETQGICSTTDRTERWQVYNTATVFPGICTDIDEGAIEINETSTQTCLIEDVATISTNTIQIQLDEEFTDLASYVNDNPSLVIPEITPYLIDTYPDECTPTFIGDCGAPTLESERNLIGDVVGEVKVIVEKLDSEYTPSIPPKICSPYKIDTSTGSYLNDTDFMNSFMPCDGTSREPVYLRDSDFVNEVCAYAETIPVINDPTASTLGIFMNYKGSDDVNTIVGTQTTENNNFIQTVALVSATTGNISVNINGTIYTTTYSGSPSATMSSFYTTHKSAIETQTSGTLSVATNTVSLSDALVFITEVTATGDIVTDYTTVGNFTKKLHKGALFFKGTKDGRDKIVFEISKNSSCGTNIDALDYTNQLRYTIYEDCSATTILDSGLVTTTSGVLEILDLTTYPNNFYVAIDAPLQVESIRDTGCFACGADPLPACDFKTVYKIVPSCGCFSVRLREIENKYA